MHLASDDVPGAAGALRLRLHAPYGPASALANEKAPGFAIRGLGFFDFTADHYSSSIFLRKVSVSDRMLPSPGMAAQRPTSRGPGSMR